MISDPTPAARFASVVDDLYAGTLDDAVWDRAMLGVADMVRASSALLLAVNPSTGAILRNENHRCDPDGLRQYVEHWTFEDRRREYFLTAPVGQPETEVTLGIPDWCHSPILNEFLLPFDFPHFMPTWLHKSETKVVALSLLGSRKRGPFEGHDIETVRQISPHVSRALEIRDRLESVQVRADTLARSLNGISFGVIVLDRDGKILEANALAQELLRHGQGICRKPDGTLCLREPASSQLRRWLTSGQPPEQCVDGLLHAARQGALPLSIMVTPLPRQTTSWMSGDPRWLLLVFDPEQRTHASAKLIALDLGISPREAEVAALLVAGLTLGAVARRLGVSEHTARSQLKSIFSKTGTHTQSDLVRRIALGPAQWRSPDLAPPSSGR